MRILYSAGKRVGADLLLSRFLNVYHSNYEVRVAAYEISSQSIDHIDWTLDAVYNKFTGADRVKLSKLLKCKDLPMMGYNQAIQLMRDIDEYAPDLVICDYEPIVSNMAAVLGFELWYCSPVHLLDGLVWKSGQLRYTGLLEVTRKNLSKLPRASRTFVCSPFALVKGLVLKEGYEWLLPHGTFYGHSGAGTGVCVTNDSDRLSELSKILNCVPPFDLTLYSTHRYDLSHLESYLLDDAGYGRAVGSADWMFCTGESSFICDGILNNVKRFCVAPDLNDPEALLNAILVKEYGLGEDVTQVELLEHLSVEEIQKSYEKRHLCKYDIRNVVVSFLEEEIERWRSTT